MNLRLATEKEIPTIVDMWMQMMDEHQGFDPRVRLSASARYSYESYVMLHIRGPKSMVIIAEKEGAGIVGFCCAYVCQNLPMFEPQEFGFISDIFVLPEHRKTGVGQAIVEKVRLFFRGFELENIQLQVYNRNERGMRFWKKCGFEPYFQRMCLELDYPGKRDEEPEKE
ncbi:MAG: N-acetyltransferase family protein [Candidatus Sumerlaeia bacterium]